MVLKNCGGDTPTLGITVMLVGISCDLQFLSTVEKKFKLDRLVLPKRRTFVQPIASGLFRKGKDRSVFVAIEKSNK
ncbi:hypothetical protein ACTXT7_010869, partial [Hymenolepis weldensis]